MCDGKPRYDRNGEDTGFLKKNYYTGLVDCYGGGSLHCMSVATGCSTKEDAENLIKLYKEQRENNGVIENYYT